MTDYAVSSALVPSEPEASAPRHSYLDGQGRMQWTRCAMPVPEPLESVTHAEMRRCAALADRGLQALHVAGWRSALRLLNAQPVAGSPTHAKTSNTPSLPSRPCETTQDGHASPPVDPRSSPGDQWGP